MAVKLSALCTSHTLLPERSSDTHFCERLNKPQGLERPEGLGKWKKFTSLYLEPATFWLVA
jgi:hypothetical protein